MAHRRERYLNELRTVLRKDKNGAMQGTPQTWPDSKLMLRLAMRAVRSELEDMQQLANAAHSHSEESDEASLIEPIEPD